ncbi:hypothetical protein LMJF_28_0230 [Leishmania major strain Friedlin]|uniref:Uncharacterized protein n=1 Tax=Leishmania major TaxID=5664 RepID=Q4Q8P7_LEIMA|nr:hypothetical protein LMJF_28_0230 [Leishmania major strain Friedlin]CAG9577060.1 hypothetical_protein_-_conserved [Leishmania major strain Friedlin]CAJ04784.1 hypothetical protein LMJF_28_0230 [Leishmania major strain Friedlin]|eukprot:XP_001684301.1 hypothetical protein LMJF_28_0230 [Leishmania major strain Friedlin]
MAPDGPDTVTEASVLATPQGKAADGHLGCATPQVRGRDETLLTEDATASKLHGEMNATACREEDEDDERLSQSSAESWVELNMAEQGKPSETECAPADVSASTPVVDVAPPVVPFLGASEDAGDEHSLGVLEAQEEAAPSPPAPQEPSCTQLRATEVEVSALIPLLMVDEATARVSEIEAAIKEAEPEQLSSYWSDGACNSDDLASMYYDEMQRSQTVNVDPDSMISVSESRVAANRAPMVDSTEALRRRVIQEDFMRTERGSPDVPPEERVAIVEALFGNFGNEPISAETFCEVMVPYKRHCECLGASYGFHHQGCRFFADFPISL